MVPSILLFLLFVYDVLLVGRRVSDGFRGVLPPVILGSSRVFAVESEVGLILPVVGLGLLTPPVVVDEHHISLVNSPLRLRCRSRLLRLLLSWL